MGEGRGGKRKKGYNEERKEENKRKKGRKQTAGEQGKLRGSKFRWQSASEIIKGELKLCHCGRHKYEKDDVDKAVCDMYVFQKATENIKVK